MTNPYREDPRPWRAPRWLSFVWYVAAPSAGAIALLVSLAFVVARAANLPGCAAPPAATACADMAYNLRTGDVTSIACTSREQHLELDVAGGWATCRCQGFLIDAHLAELDKSVEDLTAIIARTEGRVHNEADATQHRLDVVALTTGELASAVRDLPGGVAALNNAYRASAEKAGVAVPKK